MTIKQEEPKTDMISRADAKQIMLDTFADYVNAQAMWIGEVGKVDDRTKDSAVIALAHIDGALRLMREVLEEI